MVASKIWPLFCLLSQVLQHGSPERVFMIGQWSHEAASLSYLLHFLPRTVFSRYVRIPCAGLKNSLPSLRRPQRQTILTIYSDDVYSQMPSKYSTCLLGKNKAGFWLSRVWRVCWTEKRSVQLAVPCGHMQGFGGAIEEGACHEHSFFVYKQVLLVGEPLAFPPPPVSRL